MFGVGDMYLSESSNHTVSTERDNMVPEGNEVSVSPMLNFEEDIIPTPQTNYSHPQNYNSVKSTRSEIEKTEVKFVDKPQRKIIEIRVFYDDQTYDTFEPKKK
jgi:hypothetical protein